MSTAIANNTNLSKAEADKAVDQYMNLIEGETYKEESDETTGFREKEMCIRDRGSALGALNGEAKWVEKVMELMNAVDEWIPLPSQSRRATNCATPRYAVLARMSACQRGGYGAYTRNPS